MCPHVNIVQLVEKSETRVGTSDLEILMVFELCPGKIRLVGEFMLL